MRARMTTGCNAAECLAAFLGPMPVLRKQQDSAAVQFKRYGASGGDRRTA